ncbi:MAG: S9 family peptidase [Gammaproteobacteria bacterium]|nr:S9 family peptidase [Gammaproteobacteria bacterium]MBU1556648.1 S9 family peptidase [Gammaproteobacteria bacterium]MBU2069912.1 S9 family peptidase [Gammaproteobacteria bacterium]MBU2184806.1 S9 family peptidase [Gammaproteobacteria bacterium]MBU2204342.1 S9 family peptidase [Gammaproteobacteria bacterium]
MKLSAVCALLLGAVLSAVSAAKELPVEAFASAPAIDKLKLSPDGSKLSMIQTLDTEKEQLVLVKLFDLQTGEQKYLVKADSRDLRIYSVIWANNKQLLMRAAYASHRYGTPVTETRLMLIDVETGKNRSVVNGQLQRKLVRTPQFQSNIVALMPEDEHNILLALDGFSYGTGTSVVKVSLNGELHEMVAHARKDLYDWVADRQHRPRIALFRDDTRFEVQEKMLDTKEFRTLWQFELFSEQEVWPIGFDADPNILYVSAYHEGKLAIFKTDLSAAQPTLQLVKADENYDVPADISYSWQDNKVIAIGEEYVDADYQAFQKAVDKALPDADNHIVSMSHDKNRYIIETSSATSPGSYLLGDRKEKSMTFLLDKYSQLDPELMVAKQKIQYQARDGLNIEGYLTTPLGYQQGVVPTIIFPHGGPISFDDEGFDYWTQFFANRGYAVLQMNFRGSHGYGFDFKQMGLQGWGLQMQDDVEDGTRWLINKGIADPKRICIVGASYGGYAALMGAVKTPDLYQCAVSFAGVTDVEALVKSHRRYNNYEVVKKQVGDDFDLLEQRSPVNHADKIQLPVLLVHGTKDRSVPVKQSVAMYKALKSENKDVQYIELEDGDHYLSTNSHRLQTFKAMDRFLKQHLNSPSQQALEQ